MSSLEKHITPFSKAIVRLLKSTVERNSNVWDDVINYQTEIQDYISKIGLELIVKKDEGFAFVKQLEDSEGNTLGLVQRRQIGFETSIVLVVLRQSLEDFDSNPTQLATEKFITNSEIKDELELFLPEKYNKVKFIKELDKYINAAVDLIDEFDEVTFAILKHNNACGLASRPTVLEAWKDALAGDPVSAFGGVLVTNAVIDKETAEEINKLFFEVIIAPDYDVDALEILGQKKNRIILVRKEAKLPKKQFRSLLNGVLVQERDLDVETPADLKQVTEKAPTATEIEDMLFANNLIYYI